MEHDVTDGVESLGAEESKGDNGPFPSSKPSPTTLEKFDDSKKKAESSGSKASEVSQDGLSE